jgi:hypothetical protein
MGEITTENELLRERARQSPPGELLDAFLHIVDRVLARVQQRLGPPR